MFSFFSKLTSANVGNAYDYIFSGIDGDTIKLSDYKDKVIVVVNVQVDVDTLLNMRIFNLFGLNTKIRIW